MASASEFPTHCPCASIERLLVVFAAICTTKLARCGSFHYVLQCHNRRGAESMKHAAPCDYLFVSMASSIRLSTSLTQMFRCPCDEREAFGRLVQYQTRILDVSTRSPSHPKISHSHVRNVYRLLRTRGHIIRSCPIYDNDYAVDHGEKAYLSSFPYALTYSSI